jgi:DNA-binding PadR family transcriptional regulator
MGIMSPRQKNAFTHEHAVLGFLTAQPAHAYALHARLHASPVGQIWHIKQSAFYAIVSRLQLAGLVTTAPGEDETRGKRLLECTPAGVAAFSAWCAAPVAHPRDIRIEFLAKLYFCSLQGPDAVAALYDAQVPVCRSWVAHSARPMNDDPYRCAVQHYRSGQIHATIDWLQQCRALFVSTTKHNEEEL